MANFKYIGPGVSRSFKALPSFTFFFSAKKQACGPGGRALRGKSIGGKGFPSRGAILFPQNEAGLSGAHSREARDAPKKE
jgi:hypothetical protein